MNMTNLEFSELVIDQLKEIKGPNNEKRATMGGLGLLIFVAVFYLNDISKELSSLTSEMKHVAETVKVQKQQMQQIDDTLRKHDSRIIKLEYQNDSKP